MKRQASGEHQEVILVNGVANVEFSYFGGGGDDTAPRWSNRWEDAAKLPLLVRMHVQFPVGDRRRWPDLVIAPAITGSLGEG
jgi:general secretion pathway protein J